jgi:uncharacterized membrane protein YdbT with pleckstrin-like domain
MGRYVQSTLMDGEAVVYEAEVSWIIFIKPGVIGGFFCLIGQLWGSEGGRIMWGVGLTFALLGIVAALIRRGTTEIAVTDKRIILKTGFIKRETMEQMLEKIDSISVEQSIIERVGNAGTIIVRGSGQSSSPVANIDNPLQFRKMVNEQTDRSKRRI